MHQVFFDDLMKLTSGAIGSYSSCEVTELIDSSDPASPILVLSVAVLSEADFDATVSRPGWISNRIRLGPSGSKCFGVFRYSVPIAELAVALKKALLDDKWVCSGDGVIRVSGLMPVGKCFIPVDGTDTISINGLLKNNFRNGSYLLELFDGKKDQLRFLLDQPPLLAELAEAIRRVWPIALDALSDRLGNIIVQFPVTAFVAEFQFGEGGSESVRLVGRSQETFESEGLQLQIRQEHDGIVERNESIEVLKGHAESLPQKTTGKVSMSLVDASAGLIMAALAPVAPVRSIHMATRVAGRSRRFNTIGLDGHTEQQTVSLVSDAINSVVGESNPDQAKQWIDGRIYQQSITQAISQKEFVQYGSPVFAGPEEAMADLRWLVQQHGRHGVALWDPYLDAKDVINVLFFADAIGAPLRALGSPKRQKLDHKHNKASFRRQRFCCQKKEIIEGGMSNWIQTQRAMFESDGNNHTGLNLEVRVRRGNNGWPFHDRFLMFPKCDGRPALAWSLGASVNQFGKEHHILQKALDGQRVVDAFDALWKQLESDECLVWKSPSGRR